jgi:thiopurine S-methyltransferase
LVPDTIDEEGYEEWRADGVVLRCGDFFDLKAGDLEGVAGVYDRASLIALPPDSRPAYAEHLVALLPLAAPLLLITLEYDQGEMSGPPFSVTEEEVRLLFGRVRAVDLIYERDVLGEHGRFRERGLNRLHEKVYLLEAPR